MTEMPEVWAGAPKVWKWPLFLYRLGQWGQHGLRTVLVTLGALVGWRAGQYGWRLWQQPRYGYVPPQLPGATAVSPSPGFIIAATNLRDGIEKRPLPDGQETYVLCAGRRNFREPWARDFSFASFGLLALGETQVVRDGLALFERFQQPNGQFPVKIHATSALDRYLHSLLRREQPAQRPLRPKYVTAHHTISLDGNCLLIIATLNYVQQTGNEAFGRSLWPALLRALRWLDTYIHAEDGLLHQAAFTDWADSIARTGRVLYTNVLYWKALHDMAQAAPRLGTTSDHAYLTTCADMVQQAIQAHFWRPNLGYFITSQQFEFLNSSGNLLAIAWGLATPAQAQQILDKMAAFGMASPVPTQVSHRAYPRQFIAIENRLAGIPDYHTHAAWLWLGAWHVIALAKVGRPTEAQTLLQRIDEVIAREGVVHEVYGRNGQPLSTRWYTSEAPLTWNAGMVVYAHQQMTTT